MKKRSGKKILSLALAALLLAACAGLLFSQEAKASGGEGKAFSFHHEDGLENNELFAFHDTADDTAYTIGGMENTIVAVPDDEYAGQGCYFRWFVSEYTWNTMSGPYVIGGEEAYISDRITYTFRPGYVYYCSVTMYDGEGHPITQQNLTLNAYEKYFLDVSDTSRPRTCMKVGETKDFSDVELMMYSAEARGGTIVRAGDHSSGLQASKNGIYSVSGLTATGVMAGRDSLLFWSTNTSENPTIYPDYHYGIVVTDRELSFGMQQAGYNWYTPDQNETVYIQKKKTAGSWLDCAAYDPDGKNMTLSRVSSGTDASGTSWVTDKAELTAGQTYYFVIDKVDANHTFQISKEPIPDPKTPVSIANASISSIGAQYYTGSPIEPAFTVTVDDVELQRGQDYTVVFENNVEPGWGGTAGNSTWVSMTLTGIGNYTGTRHVDRAFVIRPVPQFFVLSPRSAELLPGETLEVTVTGEAVGNAQGLFTELTFESSDPAVAAVTGADRSFTVTGTGLGSATITVTALGNKYYEEETNTFKVEVVETKRESLKDAVVADIPAQTYSGKELTPIPLVTMEGKTLAEGVDYELTYTDNVNAGQGRVRITGIGHYKDRVTRTFQILPAQQLLKLNGKTSLTVSPVAGTGVSVKVTGAVGALSYSTADKAIAAVKATAAGCSITGVKVGTVKITVKAAADDTGNYEETVKTITVKVVPKATSSLTASNLSTGVKLTWKKVTGANGYLIYRKTGTGEYKQVKKITSASTLTYTDTGAKTNGTKYTYKVVPTSKYGDGKEKTVVDYYVARPAAPTLSSTTAKKMTVKWKKNAKATGYEIWYGTSKSFGSGTKKVTVTKAATVSKILSSLTSKKTYYVKIRAYKTVSGKTYNSAWSAVSSIKVK